MFQPDLLQLKWQVDIYQPKLKNKILAIISIIPKTIFAVKIPGGLTPP